MNLADSIARTKLLGATTSNPAVSDGDVAALVAAYPIPDATGATVDAPGWEPTYDVNAAVAEVWRIKAGRVAGDFNFSADDASYSKGDVLAHCLEMEAKFQAMVGSATGTGTGNSGTITIGGTNAGLPRDWQALIP